MRRLVIGILISTAGLCGCGDHDTITEPPPPLDVSGTWHGGVTSDHLERPCASPEPGAVTVTFAQTDQQVTGTLTGACLDGATFEGRVDNQQLRGATRFGETFARGFCAISSPTGGPGSRSRLSLDVDIQFLPPQPEIFGCSPPADTSGSLRLELER